MTKEQLQWAMYEAYSAQLLARIEAQEAEIANLGKLAEQARADSVTRAAADEKRIEALRYERDKWKVAYDDRCALLDVIHSSLGIEKGHNVIGEIDRLHKVRNGLLTQVQDLRAALAQEQELHAATALRLSTEAAKLVERKHPVEVGEWVKRTRFAHSEGTKINTIAQVVGLDPDGDYLVSVAGSEHCWCPSNCTPCDPPTADHDTPEGKAAAESVIRDDRKTEPKPGDTVRLVRIPTPGPDFDGFIDFPWNTDWGAVGDVATVVATLAPPGLPVVAVRVSSGIVVWWPLSCIEVVRSKPADEIKAGDLVEVFQATGPATIQSDIGASGLVVNIIPESAFVHEHVQIDSDGDQSARLPFAGMASIHDVRKVTT